MTAFAALPRRPAEHFALHFYGAVLALRDRLGTAAPSFLEGYVSELDTSGIDDPLRWWEAVADWERDARGHLPLRGLRVSAGLQARDFELLFLAGLVEEDPRFGQLLDALQGGSGAALAGTALLGGWWPEPAGRAAARAALRRLLELGLLVPRGGALVEVDGAIWDVLRGDAPRRPTPWSEHRPAGELPGRAELVLSAATGAAVDALPAVLAEGRVGCVIVRGPRGSGRHAVAGALALRLGRGLLASADPLAADDPRWRSLVVLARAMDAVPLAMLEPGPGELAAVPESPLPGEPLVVVAGRSGTVGGPGAASALTIELDVPDPAARRLHWLAGAGDRPFADAERLAVTQRLGSGTIRQLARLAGAEAMLAGREAIAVADVARARRRLDPGPLEALATLVPATGGWDDLAVDAETGSELLWLERRCRCRERLGEGPGVRALFSGPSGTGKTLAARLLAAALGMDLWRLDVGTVVDKYLGETEKRLAAVLDRAEEIDALLLLDEGDALLARRTDVHSANDRYANLETNYLLQRLEDHRGVIVVTTNAGERLDPAFQRRLDVVVDFRAPGPVERMTIWALHLPSGHDVDPDRLSDVAARCALTGGQIRNAALHASLLAMTGRGVVTEDELDAAIRREYRKAGAVCPLRPPEGAHA